MDQMPANSNFNIANSTTIRISQYFDLEASIQVYCNRGVNGIDGCVSTFIGQFADNLAFACVVSKIFFGWTWTQVLLCSLTGAIFELLWEIVLGPLSYKMVKKWKEHNVGAEYLKMEESVD